MRVLEATSPQHFCVHTGYCTLVCVCNSLCTISDSAVSLLYRRSAVLCCIEIVLYCCCIHCIVAVSGAVFCTRLCLLYRGVCCIAAVSRYTTPAVSTGLRAWHRLRPCFNVPTNVNVSILGEASYARRYRCYGSGGMLDRSSLMTHTSDMRPSHWGKDDAIRLN